MFDSNLFPGMVQFGLEPQSGTNPPLHLVLTLWLKTTSRKVVFPVNSEFGSNGQRLAYLVFESTGLIHAGLEAFRLNEVCSCRPSDLALSTYQQVFAKPGHQSILKPFLQGIVAHG